MLWLDEWTKNKIGQLEKGKNEQPLSRELLKTYQLRMLNETLNMAYEKSAFYADRIGKVTLTSLEEIRDLPFMTPEDLIRRGTDLCCVPASEISRVVTLYTSGTTGNPKRIAFTREDQELTIDFFHHGMQNLVGKNDRVLILMPVKREGSVGDLLYKGLERMGIYALKYGYLCGEEADALECAEIILSEKITSIVGLPDEVAMLANECKKITKKENISIKTVLLSGEYVSCESRDTIRRAWNCKVFEHYGMTEMGLGCAVSCEALEGYHVRESDLYIEIIDPKTDAPVSDGEYGEIVFTTLNRKAMPFIRYKTGDRSRWVTEQCPCGSKLKRLERVESRVYC